MVFMDFIICLLFIYSKYHHCAYSFKNFYKMSVILTIARPECYSSVENNKVGKSNNFPLSVSQSLKK